MNNYPTVLLDIRSWRGGLTTQVGIAPEPSSTGSLVVEEFGRRWPLPSGGVECSNTIEWTDEQVVVRTSQQNSTILYYWIDTAADRVLIGTDLAEITARVISAAGVQSDRIAQIRSHREAIKKIGGGRTVVFARRAGAGALEITDTMSRSWRPTSVAGETAVEAGNRQIEALRREIVAVGEPRPVTAVVSGGVDSGLVAALAQQAGILDHLATLGTPWGDEFAEAAALGAHLGMPVREIMLSENDILQALPETVRMLGGPTAETASGAVNLVAVYQQGQIPAGTVLTGYGADLINSGLRVGAHRVDDLRAEVAQRLAEAALAGEFSGLAAATHGYAQRHMYWNTAVIQAALDTAPELMRYRDREKGHMRVAAQQLLPESIAWRPKLAVHQGSGVQRNLAGAIARRIGMEAIDVERFYALIDAELVGALVSSPHEPIDSEKCLEAAISAYAREC
ncbi:asparagine synthase-related protein [Nocardia sp. NPDC051463]|uniref:asparagine synthase C-terminal domain-containing protein n=1 Tax=Nocardia sp. NPDC051463 TaxID=3154845 RepID=UPI00341AC04A